MKILVVAKESNLEIHGSRVERLVSKGLVPKSTLEHLQKAHTQHYETLAGVRSALKARGLAFTEVSRRQEWPADSLDLVITVGGDGTVLHASQHTHTSETKVVGIRSSDDSVGFLCAFDRHNYLELIEKVGTTQLPHTTVHRLCAKIKFIDSRPDLITLPVMNDFLFSNANPAQTTRYAIEFGDRRETHRSSGVWISTAIGSSAAISAAGGKRIPYHESLAQFAVRELFRAEGVGPATLACEIFDPAKTSLVFESWSDKAVLALDGQHGIVNLNYGDRVSILPSSPLSLVPSPKLSRFAMN